MNNRHQGIWLSVICSLMLLGLMGCQQRLKFPPPQSPWFVESETVLSLEPRSRRKWDAAVISDLDQDGFEDLLLTDHGYRINIYWNNQGVYSEPQVLIIGDTHGVAVTDVDFDGKTDVLVSMGGGGGKKPRYPMRFIVDRDRHIAKGQPFPLFARSRGRGIKLLDADQDGDTDVFFTAFPLDSQPQGANYFYQNKQGQLEYEQLLPQAKWLGYKSLVTFINDDTDPDILLYGGDNMIAVVGQKGRQFTEQTDVVLGDLTSISHGSSITPFDYDNDGDLDLFVTRAKHQFEEQRYFDAVHRRFGFFVRRQTFLFEDMIIDGNFELTNLQMAYPDFDVFVGEEQRLITFDLDRHGEKWLSLSESEAKGWPEEIRKPGLYIGYVGNGVWRVGGHTTAPMAGVINRVLSTPSTTEPVYLPAKLLENRNGQYVDVTSAMGIAIPEQTSHATSIDVDNDGWLDLVVMRYGSMAQQNEQLVYRNKNGAQFERVEALQHGIVSKELGATGSGIVAVDLDADGDEDTLFANERGRWHVFLSGANQINDFVAFDLTNMSTYSLMDSRLDIEACGRSQTKWLSAVSSGFSSYARTKVHFGVGQCHNINRARLTLSDGQVFILDSIESGRTHTFKP